MKKRILCTLIFSLLVLTSCSSDTPNATPNESTPTAIVRTQAKKTVSETVVATEKYTAPTETETVGVTTESEQQVEIEIVEQIEESKAPHLLKS